MLIYPAHIDSPTIGTAKELTQAYARAGCTAGWAPSCMLGAITVLWGIKGAPRCPSTVIRAAAATAAFAG
eukprot:4532317-Lingulodinium_polyedra.AAC.1